jgi:hypothetical protein
MVAWALAIGLSIAALVVSAASRPGNVAMAYAHLAIAATAAMFFALFAVRSLKALSETGASRTAIAADAARSIGLVWVWGALVIAVTYGTGVLGWKEWMKHFYGMFGAGGLCLAVAAILGKSSAGGGEDETMLTLSRYLAIGQLVALLVLIVGFLFDGQMLRFLNERFTDWPAKNVIFFGAIAIAAISGASLKYVRR